MKKTTFIILLILILTMTLVVGCNRNNNSNEHNQNHGADILPEGDQVEEPHGGDPQDGNPQEDIAPEEPDHAVVDEMSLGGITIQTTADEVTELLGDNFTEDTYDEGGYFGEAYSIWWYDEGIELLVGAESKEVIQMEVSSSKFKTNLGFGVGDDAQEVLEVYRSLYEEYEGANSNGKLPGWFVNDEGVLLIFSFNEDGSRFNEKIDSDAKVTHITLAHAMFFD